MDNLARLRRRIAALKRDLRAAAGVEFALLAFPLIFGIFGACEAGFDLYQRSVLDHITANVARQILTGGAQQLTNNGAPLSQQQFITQVVCANLPAVMTCSNFFVSITDFSEGATPSPFYNAVNAASSGLAGPQLNNANNAYCLGNSSQYVIVQITYPLPLFSNIFGSGNVTTYNGSQVRLMTSTAAFRNEPFPTGNYQAPAGC